MTANSTDRKTLQLVYTALMTTLVLLGTMVLRIPIPMTQGYVHLGDSMIFLGVLLFGRRSGTIAAGLGSSLADILGGYSFWAPWTLIIKGFMAFVAALIIERNPESKALKIAGMSIGGIIMTAGYFIAEALMYGNKGAAALGIPWNIGQAAVGILVSSVLALALSRVTARS